MQGRVTPLPVVFFLVSSLAVADTAPGQSAGPAPPAQTATARITESTLRSLIEAATEPGGLPYLGIRKVDGDIELIYIASNRQLIAFSAAQAVLSGGRYSPPPEMRSDIVRVTCGDADIGERWDCGRLVVLSAGHQVVPVSYRAGPRVYRNALGASWSATTASATYRLRDLTAGFTVRAFGTDGVEYQQVVEREAVADQLFAAIPKTRAQLAAILDAEPEPPHPFAATITPTDTGWIIANDSPHYTWASCELIYGTTALKLPPLTPGGPVMISKPATATATERPYLRCQAKGRRYEGPVPAELLVSVERTAGVWAITNLTEWGWAQCDVALGDALARIAFLRPKTTAVLAAADFRPSPPEVSDSSSLVITCLSNHRRVAAILR